MPPSIGVLLTSFRRQNLKRQLAAVRAQSHAPADIIVFHNEGGVAPDPTVIGTTKTVACNWNSGVWPRFLFPLWGMATDFVAIFDDDTIPGPRCFEHLLKCFAERPGLYVENGVLCLNGRQERQYFGWSCPVDRTVRVDYGGHLWFLPREWLRLAGMIPDESTWRMGDCTCGEDMHLSYAMQQYGHETFVAPHPPADRSTWGSTDGKLGTDQHALYLTEGEEVKKQAAFDYYRGCGWKLVADEVEHEVA